MNYRDVIKELNELEESQELHEMARVCFLPPSSVKGVEVYVNTDDAGNVPHFHIRKRSGENKYEWESCVMYTEPSYFNHEKHHVKLPGDYPRILNKVLKQKNKKIPTETYWQTAINMWNINNSSMDLPFDLKQPDYSRL